DRQVPELRRVDWDRPRSFGRNDCLRPALADEPNAPGFRAAESGVDAGLKLDGVEVLDLGDVRRFGEIDFGRLVTPYELGLRYDRRLRPAGLYGHHQCEYERGSLENAR